MTDGTDIRHYTNYPVCGFCVNAWDAIYARKRTSTSPLQWVGYCRYGGCDPDVWDFIDEDTGWPPGWKISEGGQAIPLAYSDKKIKLKIPKHDDRMYHRRSSEDVKAPWRAMSNKLRKQAAERKERKKNIKDEDIVWDEEPEDVVLVATEDLDDADIW